MVLFINHIGTNMLHFGAKPKEPIQIIYFMTYSTFKQPWWTTAMLWSVYNVDQKQRSYTSVPSSLTWCQERGRKNNTGKNVNILNLIRNSSLCSCHFNKDYTRGDPVYFARNNWRKSLKGCLWSAKPQMSVSAASWYMIIHSSGSLYFTSIILLLWACKTACSPMIDVM